MTHQQTVPQVPQTGNQNPPVLSLSAKGLWAVVAGAAAAFALVASESYTFGRTYEQGLANGKVAEQKGTAEQAQIKLVAAQERNAQLAEANAKFNQANGQLLEILKAKNEQIERLSAQVGAVNNCAFLHGQIRTLEREAAQIGEFMFGAQESEDRQQARRTALGRASSPYNESTEGPRTRISDALQFFEAT